MSMREDMWLISISSVQFSHSVVSESLQPHESQHARPPCPSPSPRVHPDSCPSSPWCHPAISSWVIPFSSCPQSLPASVFSNESTLRMRCPKYWSFSFSIIPSKEIPGLISVRMDWLDLLVGNLISGFSVFSKTSLNIRKFMVHILLNLGLENFEHYFTIMWSEVKLLSHVWLCATP